MSVAEIAAAAGAELQAAPRPKQIEVLEVAASGEVTVTAADGTRMTMLAAGEVSEHRRPSADALISGAELINFLQRRGALPVPVRAARYVRRRIRNGNGDPACIFSEVGR